MHPYFLQTEKKLKSWYQRQLPPFKKEQKLEPLIPNGLEEVIWKQERDTSKHGKRLCAIGAPRQGVLRCSERGQSLLQVTDCNVASWCAGELSSKKRGSQAPEATGSCCVCVSMCHRLTEMTNWVVGERPEQLESLCKKPRGVSSGVLLPA